MLLHDTLTEYNMSSLSAFHTAGLGKNPHYLLAKKNQQQQENDAHLGPKNLRHWR